MEETFSKSTAIESCVTGLKLAYQNAYFFWPIIFTLQIFAWLYFGSLAFMEFCI